MTVLIAGGCAPATGSKGGEGASTGTGTGTDGTDGTDGDGNTGDGDGDGDPSLYCDPSQFPTIEPIWYEALPVDQPGFARGIRGVAIADGGLYAAEYQFSGEPPESARITRRTLGGEFVWATQAQGFSGSLDSDGEHVYFVSKEGIGRVGVDGSQDGWLTPKGSWLSIVDIDVSGPTGVAIGTATTEVGDPSYTDAALIIFTKATPGAMGPDLFGEPGSNESGYAVTALSGGEAAGAMMRKGNDAMVWVRSIDGPGPNADLSFSGNGEDVPKPAFFVERPDGVLLGGTTTKAGNHKGWLLKMEKDGPEVWRKALEPCGAEISSGLNAAAATSDRIWALFGVATGPGPQEFGHLLVQIDFEGEILAAHQVNGPEGTPRSTMEFIAAEGDAVVVAGWVFNPDAEISSWLARVH